MTLSTPSATSLPNAPLWATQSVTVGLLLGMGLWLLQVWLHASHDRTAHPVMVSFFSILGWVFVLTLLYFWVNEHGLAWKAAQGEVVRVARSSDHDGDNVYVRIGQEALPVLADYTETMWTEDDLKLIVVRFVGVTGRSLNAGQHVDVAVAYTRWSHEVRVRVPCAHVKGKAIRHVVAQPLSNYEWLGYNESKEMRLRQATSQGHAPVVEPLMGLQSLTLLHAGYALMALIGVGGLGFMGWAVRAVMHARVAMDVPGADMVLFLTPLLILVGLAGLYTWLDGVDLDWKVADVVVVRREFAPARQWAHGTIGPYANVLIKVSADQLPHAVKADAWSEPATRSMVLIGRELDPSSVFPNETFPGPITKTGQHLTVALAMTRWTHLPRVRLPCAFYGSNLPVDAIPLRSRIIAQPIEAYQWANYDECQKA
jgi:hypothetical protein